MSSPGHSRMGSQVSAVIDTEVIYCGDNIEQLAKLPPHCIDPIYIDPPFNSNRNYEVFWIEKRGTSLIRAIVTGAPGVTRSNTNARQAPPPSELKLCT